jgi:polyisoprenoid-binding protein YceI
MRISKAWMLAAAVVLGGTAQVYADASGWDVDGSHVTAQFSVSHMMISTVRGQFDKVSGTVNIDDKVPANSSLDVTIDAKSINTREPKRDDHLRSPDFFDVAKFPSITFKSTKVEKAGGGKLKVTGDLTIRGITKPAVLIVEKLSLPVKNPWGMTVRGVSAKAKINRKDWGLTWNKALETGGVLVGEEVELQIDAELIQKAPVAAAAK